jgi:hypothetical protein
MKTKVLKTELVEVLVPANSTGVNYAIGQQYTNLQGGRVTKIEVLDSSIVSKSPKNVNNINSTVMGKAYLETFDSGKLLMNKMPLARLRKDAGVPEDVPELVPFKIDLSSTKIVLSESTGIAGTDEAFILLFYYE